MTMHHLRTLRALLRHCRQPLAASVVFAIAAASLVALPHATPTAHAAPLPSLTEYQPSVAYGGRAVAVDISPADANTAIVASESGGLFKTTNGGVNWSHLDTFPGLRMSDVKYDPGDATIVIASSRQDTLSVNAGGILRSTDGGAHWQKPPTSEIPCAGQQSSLGIAFAAGTSDVFVGTQCGLEVSHDVGKTWAPVVLSTPVYGVVAQAGGANGTIVDTCGQVGHLRSTDGGVTFADPATGTDPLLNCGATFGAGSHAITVSPFESGVILAAPTANTVYESDDGGQTWTNLNIPSAGKSGRAPYVKTHVEDATHFILYASNQDESYWQTCNASGPGLRCSTTWKSVSRGHGDPSEVAFPPGGTCPEFMTDDGGIEKANATCPGPSFSQIGQGSSGGYNALQIYDMTGEVHPDHTDLYFGTQDNQFWASEDNGATWPFVTGTEGFFLQIPHTSSAPLGPGDNDTITFVDCSGGPCSNQTSTAHFATPETPWSNAPIATGNPFLIDRGVYVQACQPNPPASAMCLTTDGGSTWPTIVALPDQQTGPEMVQPPRIAGPPANPTIYVLVCRNACSTSTPTTGLDKITGIRTGSPTVTAADNGLTSIGSYCNGEATYVCPFVYGVDPNNAQHLIAMDTGANQMMVTTDGGTTWTADVQLTTLVTGGGQYLFNQPNGNLSQAHTIAFDPANGNRILVGTEEAGVIASVDGGQTWTTLYSSNQATVITSFFFDNVQNDILLSTYGRGIWKVAFVQRSATIHYVGDTTADYHDPATLAATLMDAAANTPIVGARLTLSLGSQRCTVLTDSTGRAACPIVPHQAAGTYSLSASFSGDAQYPATGATQVFTITHEETTLSYTGDTLLANGSTAYLSGVLLEDGTTPISGRTVTLTLGNSATAQACPAPVVTDSSGTASCTISPVTQPVGPGTVSATFSGDTFYLPSAASAQTLVFSFPSGGDFTIGDGNASVGTAVTFWGDQWAHANTVSGGQAPLSFKGFENSSALPSCGVGWQTDPGNSPGPSATVPSYMGVIVTSQVVKSGSTIYSGTTPAIVVVKTNPGYVPDPQHPGTGTVVAVYCHG
jgi:hypothetical protein